jgi:nucleolar protein 56
MKTKWKVWFGEVDGNKVSVSEDLISSFKSAVNPNKLPFSISELGSKVFGSAHEYYRVLRKTAIAIGRNKVENELKREDRYAIMLLKTLDQLDESINLLEEKLRDVVEIKESNITDELKEKIGELKGLRKNIEKEIEATVVKISPNLSEILGAVIAARLLEKAGSLEKLASLPASTIQILGAEKSLFRAKARMKRGKDAKTPKHGVIFQHQFIRNLPKNKRGKMARFMAAKLAIAAKLDRFKGELNSELAESVRRRYEELRR